MEESAAARIKDLEELLEISKSLSSNLEYHSLLDSLLFACMGHAKVTKAGLFITDNLSSSDFTLYRNYEGFNTDKNIRYSVSKDSEVVKLFKEHPVCYTMPELLKDIHTIADIKPFTILEPTLIIPIIHKGNLQGMIVLGEKIENMVFPQSEKDFLLNIASFAAIAIYNAFLFEISTTDLMTKLKLRHVLFQTLQRDFSSGRKMPLFLLMMDIDKFKSINDTYGHGFGDVVIKGITSVIRKGIRLQDMAARYGGEEFTVVLHAIPFHEARKIAERIRQRVENLTFSQNGKRVGATISVGLAEYNPALDKKPADLIKRADTALYEAKRNGRNQVRTAP